MAYKKKDKEDSWLNGTLYVALPFEIIDSRAFKELSGNSMKVLVLLMRKVRERHRVHRFKVSFSMTYPEARKHSLAAATFSRALKQLKKVGFIDCVKAGGLTCGDGKTPSVFRLSQRWKKYGSPDFEDLHPGHRKNISEDDDYPF